MIPGVPDKHVAIGASVIVVGGIVAATVDVGRDAWPWLVFVAAWGGVVGRFKAQHDIARALEEMKEGRDDS